MLSVGRLPFRLRLIQIVNQGFHACGANVDSKQIVHYCPHFIIVILWQIFFTYQLTHLPATVLTCQMQVPPESIPKLQRSTQTNLIPVTLS